MDTASENLPVAFAALLAGGLLLEHGLSTLKPVFTGTSTPSTSSSSSASSVAASAPGDLSLSGLVQLWVANGGNPTAAPMAAAIAWAESRGKQNAVNQNTNGSTDRGYWQVNSIHGAQSTFDANGNARAAIAISNNGTDWSPWTTFGSGAYQGFLAAAQAAAHKLGL